MLAHDSTFDRADIFVYSYPTTFRSTFSIDELAENMRAVLVAMDVAKYRKLMFLSHSMGGLVTRAYLLKNRDVADRTVLAYFFSTPTTGSDLASLVQYLSRNPQFREMERLQPVDYLADLLRQWLAAGFSFPSYCAYEKRPTYGLAIVTMQSASALCTRALDPIDADHGSIVKPTSENSESYIAFKAAYKSVMENQRNPLDRTIAFRCAWSAPPSHYRDDKTLSIVDFQHVPITGINIDQQVAGPAYFRRSSEPFTPSPTSSDDWYRCDVINNGTQAVRNLRAKFPVLFAEAEVTQTGTRNGKALAGGYALTPPFDLGVGSADYFYFSNESTAYIEIFIPTTAVLQTTADDEWRTVKLIPPSPREAEVILSPSTNPVK
jgi:hypothetical protein